MKRVIIFASFLIITFTQNIFAQIDTNDVYPLQKGNLWEYTNNYDVHYYDVVVGSEIKTNGKNYKKIMSINLMDVDWDTLFIYRRVEDKKIYGYWNSHEYLEYDTSLPAGGISIFPSDSLESLQHGIIASNKFRYYDSWLKDTTTYFRFELGYINNAVTPPDTSILTDGIATGFSQGIGPISIYGAESITGAIINGKQYGYVTVDAKEEKPILSNYKIEIDTYPNPFNSITNVSFAIPRTQNVKLKLFNILGEEVYTLYSGELQKGENQFQITMPKEISSGIFFVLLEVEKRNYSKKILYLK